MANRALRARLGNLGVAGHGGGPPGRRATGGRGSLPITPRTSKLAHECSSGIRRQCQAAMGPRQGRRPVTAADRVAKA